MRVLPRCALLTPVSLICVFQTYFILRNLNVNYTEPLVELSAVHRNHNYIGPGPQVFAVLRTYYGLELASQLMLEKDLHPRMDTIWDELFEAWHTLPCVCCGCKIYLMVCVFQVYELWKMSEELSNRPYCIERFMCLAEFAVRDACDRGNSILEDVEWEGGRYLAPLSARRKKKRMSHIWEEIDAYVFPFVCVCCGKITLTFDVSYSAVRRMV